MTRYARSGNTRQHKKIPSDPTPWSEFSLQLKKKFANINKTDESKHPSAKESKCNENENSPVKVIKNSEAKCFDGSSMSIHSKKQEMKILAGVVNTFEPEILKPKIEEIEKFSPAEHEKGKCNTENIHEVIKKRKQHTDISTKATLSLKKQKSMLLEETNVDVVENMKRIPKNEMTEILTSKKNKHRKKRKSCNSETASLISDCILEEKLVTDASTDFLETTFPTLKTSISPTIDASINVDKRNSEKNQLKRKKKKKKHQEQETDIVNDIITPFSQTNEDSTVKHPATNKPSNSKKSKGKEAWANDSTAEELEIKTETSTEKSDEPNPVKLKNKKMLYRMRLLEKRKNNGIMLLSEKAEKRIYLLKKSLRSKGESAENIRQVARKVRRREELEYRKTMKKTCYNCRKVGHVMAACPNILADNEQGTGICFKCGSTEHTSNKCTMKSSSFKFAKCFICKQQGHLSRNCPENKHGIYPNGGKCYFCGAIDHQKLDCPRLNINRKVVDKDVQVFRADVIEKSKSVDEELMHTPSPSVITAKKQKIIKF